MDDLKRKGVEIFTKVLKYSKDINNPQAKVSTEVSSEVLEVSPVQVVFLNTGKYEYSNPIEPLKVSVLENVCVPKTIFVASKPSNKVKDVGGNDYGNINKNLKTMNTCDNPQNRNNIDMILSEKPVLEKSVEVPILYIDI